MNVISILIIIAIGYAIAVTLMTVILDLIGKKQKEKETANYS